MLMLTRKQLGQSLRHAPSLGIARVVKFLHGEKYESCTEPLVFRIAYLLPSLAIEA